MNKVDKANLLQEAVNQTLSLGNMSKAAEVMNLSRERVRQLIAEAKALGMADEVIKMEQARIANRKVKEPKVNVSKELAAQGIRVCYGCKAQVQSSIPYPKGFKCRKCNAAWAWGSRRGLTFRQSLEQHKYETKEECVARMNATRSARGTGSLVGSESAGSENLSGTESAGTQNNLESNLTY